MRDFSPVYSRFWIDPVMQSLSREARLIALHLVTGPHTTMLGCFRLPPSYVAEDLKFSVAEVESGFAELAAVDFFTVDAQSGWCVVHGFLKWNPIHNPSHAQGLEKLFEQVPGQGPVFKKLCALLQQHPKYLRAEFIQRLQTLEATVQGVCSVSVQRVPRPSRHIDTDTDTDTDTDKDTEQDTETDTEKDTEIQVKTRKEQEDEGGVLPHIVAPARPGEALSPLVLEVFDYWRATLGHPQAVLDSKRKTLIRKALQSGYTALQLCEAIRGCSLTPHNMGKNDRGQRYDGLHVILRDADQMDRFIRNAQSPPRERNAAEALLDSNVAVCQAWLQDKLAHKETVQ